jgi:hypothetical protein
MGKRKGWARYKIHLPFLITLLYLICSSHTLRCRGYFFNFILLQTVWRPLPKHRTTQTQNKHIHIPNIHVLCGIRTHDPGFRESEDSTYLRPVSYHDQPIPHLKCTNFKCKTILQQLYRAFQNPKCSLIQQIISTAGGKKMAWPGTTYYLPFPCLHDEFLMYRSSVSVGGNASIQDYYIDYVLFLCSFSRFFKTLPEKRSLRVYWCGHIHPYITTAVDACHSHALHKKQTPWLESAGANYTDQATAACRRS